jgi:hypothetical protein
MTKEIHMTENTNPFAKLDSKKAAAADPELDLGLEVEKAGESAADAGAEATTPAAAPGKKAVKKASTKAEVEAENVSLQGQIDKLTAAIEGKADVGDIMVVRDRVVQQGGVGGDVRVIGEGGTLINDDWRLTKDGLKVLLGRADVQARQNFQIPLSLADSLAEVLNHLSEIKEA